MNEEFDTVSGLRNFSAGTRRKTARCASLPDVSYSRHWQHRCEPIGAEDSSLSRGWFSVRVLRTQAAHVE